MKNLLLLTLTGIFLLGCSSDDSNPETDNPDPIKNNSIRLRDDASFGTVMTNSDGFTLYFFSSDSSGDSKCIDNCATAWPVFFADQLTLDSGLNSGDFGTITRTDGSQQTTFKGWPLYLFSNDVASGQINGDGAGDVWFVAKPDYTIMMAKAQLIGRDADGVETNLTSDYTAGNSDTMYMTDDEGNTLYGFINDTTGKNNFTASDFSNNGAWPIFEASLENVPSILNQTDFAVIDVFGRLQLTYKGWPLYYFGQDAQRGDNFGVGFPVAGIWPILNQDSPAAPAEEPSTKVTYTITNQGASAYLFSGEGLNNEVNPSITLKRGETYEFVVNAPGHPFFIKNAQTTGTGDTYDNGVTSNGASQGTISFTVPSDAPNTLFYICEFHGSMTGTFTITD